MATFSPSGGVDEREPTLISDDVLRDVDGAEYRVGEVGVFVARGRQKTGDIGSLTGRALYEAGFDGTSGFVVSHDSQTLRSAPIASSLIFDIIETGVSPNNSPIVGSHYANRHYLADSVKNRKVELLNGVVTGHSVGMAVSPLAVGVSVTQGVGDMSANTGLEYWVTEYDSVRGIESIHGSTANTGSFSLRDGVILTVTGTSSNSRADQIRWYRSTDGGGFPDGGLINTTPIGTTQITDADIATGTLTVPQYGIISIGGLDTDRDEPPPALSIIFGPFQDSLLGVASDEPRVLRFTPAGFPDSWPSGYAIPLETARNDRIVAGVVLPGRIGVFCEDSTHVIYRLPRDADSIFAAGEAQEQLTDARGCMSRRGATMFTPPGLGALAAWVARDGIWASNLTGSPVPVTDKIDWEGRVNVPELISCRLVDDPLNRRMIFIHRKLTDATHNTGIWYLDYQQFQSRGVRITFADHGPLADAATIAAPDGLRRIVSVDSRINNGQVYIEAVQDVDDSQLIDASGSVRFLMRTKEFLPAGPRGTAALGKATWMHDAGPPSILHRFYHNRRDDNPEIKPMPDTEKRGGSDVVLGRNVNSVSIEIESVGTKSYGIHWIDIEGLDVGPLGGMKGA